MQTNSNITLNAATNQAVKIIRELAIYVGKRVGKGVTYISTPSENVIWCKLSKTFFNLANDIYLGTVYLSPQNYDQNRSRDYITELEEEIIFFSTKGSVIIQGDFNDFNDFFRIHIV